MQLETCIKQGELKAKYKYVFCIKLLALSNQAREGNYHLKDSGGCPGRMPPLPNPLKWEAKAGCIKPGGLPCPKPKGGLLR